jgi:hypothetical protein
MPTIASRREAALGAAALVVLVSGVVSASTMHDDDKAEQVRREAVAQVRLSLDDSPDANGLTLANDGLEDLTVDAVEIAGTTTPVSDIIEAGGRLQVPGDAGCPATPPTAPPTELRVTVTTAQGTRTPVRIPLTGTRSVTALVAAQKDTCGYFGLEDSLTVEAGQSGNGQTLLLDLRNRSRGLRRLVGFVASPGIAVTAPDMTFPAQPVSITGPTRRLPVRLHVTSCALAKRAGSPLVAQVSDGVTTGTQDLLRDASTIAAAISQVIARQCVGAGVRGS